MQSKLLCTMIVIFFGCTSASALDAGKQADVAKPGCLLTLLPQPIQSIIAAYCALEADHELKQRMKKKLVQLASGSIPIDSPDRHVDFVRNKEKGRFKRLLSLTTQRLEYCTNNQRITIFTLANEDHWLDRLIENPIRNQLPTAVSPNGKSITCFFNDQLFYILGLGTKDEKKGLVPLDICEQETDKYSRKIGKKISSELRWFNRDNQLAISNKGDIAFEFGSQLFLYCASNDAPTIKKIYEFELINPGFDYYHCTDLLEFNKQSTILAFAYTTLYHKYIDGPRINLLPIRKEPNISLTDYFKKRVVCKDLAKQ